MKTITMVLIMAQIIFMPVLAYAAVSGRVLWTATYPAGPGWQTIAVDSNLNSYVGGQSGDLIKYNKRGTEQWVVASAGGRISEVEVDSNDNIYVAQPNSTAKYDADGNQIWAKTYTNNGYSEIAIDSANNVFRSGPSATLKYDTSGTLQWANPATNAYYLSVDSTGNVYTAGHTGYGGYMITKKYDTNGNQVWAQVYDLGWHDNANGLALDDAGNVFVIGHTSPGYAQPFRYLTIKYDTNGNQLWAKTYGGNYYYPYALAVDSTGNVVVTGVGGSYMKTVKYDPAGNPVWATSTSGYAYNIAVDGNDDIFITGSRNSHMITLKYDANGESIWETDDDRDEADSSTGNALVIDGDGDVLASGYDSNGFVTIKYKP